MVFFTLIEKTAAEYCSLVDRAAYDEEFERLYRQLRRRPDGRDSNPLFAYMQTAVRLYMSLRDVSRDEFEAVAQRLSQSARHFTLSPTSTNYLRDRTRAPAVGTSVAPRVEDRMTSNQISQDARRLVGVASHRAGPVSGVRWTGK